MQRQRRISPVTQLARLLTAASGLLIPSCQGSSELPELDALDELDEPEAPPATEELDERQRLARSGQFLLDPSAGGSAVPATASELVAALDAEAFVVDASLVGADVSASVFDQWGVIAPRRGGSFAVLSTGVIDTTPEPGTDMSGFGEADDVVTLRLDLEVPEGFSRLSFDYDFLSAESPDYVGSVYNDTFTATLLDPDGNAHPIAMASVNSSTFFDASEERAGGTFFDIFTDDPADVDGVFLGGLPDAGVTDFQPVSFELPSSGSWTLVLEIRDLGDGLLDSAVVIDDLRLHAMEPLELNPPRLPEGTRSLLEDDGTIIDDAAALAEAGRTIRGVAADGVTRVLLRTRVPGPGSVEYALEGATHPADGGVGALDGPTGGSVVVEAVETAPGEYHAFATYTAPADFDRGTDGELATRDIELRTTYTPDAVGAPGFVDIQPLVIHRPPVVLVHGIWDAWSNWTLALLDDPRFSVHKASYHGAAHLSPPDGGSQADAALAAENLAAISQAILSARLVQQQDGVAGTQVDLVAHGIGGLLARQHLDEATYTAPQNFAQGDVHKLITLGTPHLGSSLATAVVEMLDGLTPPVRTGMEGGLRSMNLAVDGGAIDDIQLGSPLIQALEATSVPSHAIIGSGGELIPRGDLTANGQIINSQTLVALGRMSPLYTFIEQKHPDTLDFTASQRLAFLFGPDSQVFAEDHDMFADVGSQQGGLDPAATTTFQSHYAPPSVVYDSVHYRVPRSSAYSSRIVELLGAPVEGTEFGSFPAPSSVLPLAPMQPPSGPSSTSSVAFNIGSYGLTILQPTSGTVVIPGETVAVSVTPDPGIGDVMLLGVATRHSAQIIEPPTFPFALDLPVPEDASGSLDLVVFGFSVGGEFLFSSVELTATPDAQLLHVHILDRNPFLFGPGDTESVEVLGLYDDGIERDITSAASGTEYLSSNPEIFTVTGGGQLVATGEGKASLIARNDGVQDSVTVEVLPGVTVAIDVTAQWNGGYCVALVATNHTPYTTTDWTITVDMGGTTITESWNGVFSGDVGVVTIEPEHAWQLGIPGGQTKDHTGFCASTPLGSPEIATVVDVTATF